jgi:hypothetical protein
MQLKLLEMMAVGVECVEGSVMKNRSRGEKISYFMSFLLASSMAEE